MPKLGSNPLYGAAGVYRIVSPCGKVYVGGSKNISKRWGRHRSEGRRGVNWNAPLQASFNEHGVDAHRFEVLELVENLDELDAREQHWIDSFDPAVLFNRNPTAGSPKGQKRTGEQRATCRAVLSRPEVKAKLVGERNSFSKLTESSVIDIKAALNTRSGEHGLRSFLASKYGVHPTAISKIATGETWSHVKLN